MPKVAQAHFRIPSGPAQGLVRRGLHGYTSYKSLDQGSKTFKGPDGRSSMGMMQAYISVCISGVHTHVVLEDAQVDATAGCCGFGR